MICHEKPLPGLPQEHRPLSGGGATIGTGVFESRVRRQERSTTAMDAGAGRIVEK
jgi:hypothetical protein